MSIFNLPLPRIFVIQNVDVQARIRDVLQEKMHEEDDSHDQGDIAEEELLHALKERGKSGHAENFLPLSMFNGIRLRRSWLTIN